VCSPISGRWACTSAALTSTTPQFLKNHPNKTKAFLRAYIEAIWTGIHNREIVDRVYRKNLKIDNPKLLEAMHKSYFVAGNLPLKPYPQLDSIQSDIDYLTLANQAQSQTHRRGRAACCEIENEDSTHCGSNSWEKARC
jgi:ABC-type nitrate/sulfonate/bicarbonate transport system substrate-binding protein